MYELSVNTLVHKRDLRALDLYKNRLITGGSDNLVYIFTIEKRKQTIDKRINIFEKSILSIRINRYKQQLNFGVGCSNYKLYILNQDGNTLHIFQHQAAVCSIDFINSNTLISGSWNGSAQVWSISQNHIISQFNQHKYAVSVMYNPLNDTVVTGSQDKTLALWNWNNGSLINQVQNAHNDIIREIVPIDGLGFITCSNDQMLKIWASDLDLIDTLIGHTAFVFSVKSISLGKYISGGDDQSIKIWSGKDCIQSIQLPASAWTIAIDENLDVYVGCSDGYLRIFTTSEERRATQQEIKAFEAATLSSASKKSGMSAQQIAKLPTISQMNNYKGKKQGEVRVFKNGTMPQAYAWQSNSWSKIGEVITQSPQQSAPKYYPGDKYFDAGEYDYVFDVDDQSGVAKKIPFNDGGNALDFAERYCMREGLNKGYIEQIRKFLMTNSSNVPRQKTTKQQIKDSASLLCTPSTTLIQFCDIKNPTALMKKMREFNEQAGDKKLSCNELGHLQRYVMFQFRISSQLENSSNYHTWSLDYKEMDTIKKILAWPKNLKLPVWDLLRAFLKHYQSEALFSGLDSGFDIIAQLAGGLECESSEAIYALILRTLSNIVIQNSSKSALLQHSMVILDALKSISARNNLKQESYLYGMASFIYNFSIAIIEKKLEKSDIICKFAEVLHMRLELDTNSSNRNLLLRAGTNVVHKYSAYSKHYEYLKDYKSGDEISKDIERLF